MSSLGNGLSERAECAPPGGLYVQCVEEAGLRRGLPVALPVHRLRAGGNLSAAPSPLPMCVFSIFLVHSSLEGEMGKEDKASPYLICFDDDDTIVVCTPVLNCSGSR